MAKLSNLERAHAIGFLEAGWTQVAVARHFGIHRKSVCRLVSRYRQTGDVKDRNRSGRSRVATRRQDRYTETSAVRRRFYTARSIQLDVQRAAGPRARRISDQTIRNRLYQAGLRAWRPARRPVLKAAHRAARLQWARLHRPWTRQQWQHVLFTDESRFCLKTVDGRLRVWRRRGERFADNCVQPVTAFRGGSVMVWAGIRLAGRTQLVPIAGNLNSQRYIAEILQPHVIPCAQLVGNGFVLQDDNARPHRARIVDAFLQQNAITRMEWYATPAHRT